MDNVTEVVALLRQQAELERRLLNGDGTAVAAERELDITRQRLAQRPHAVNAVLQTARALRRTPDAVSARDVADWGSSK